MTDFYKLVDERQSDRGYDTERSVPREAVMRIVDAARRARRHAIPSRGISSLSTSRNFVQKWQML